MIRRLLFSHRLIKKEKVGKADVSVIIKSAQKGIFQKIKGSKIPETSVIKIYVTTVSGARRIVFLLDEKTEMAYFLFFRKKDDLIGRNISIKNPVFKKTLYQYLEILDQEITADQFEVIDI